MIHKILPASNSVVTRAQPIHASVRKSNDLPEVERPHREGHLRRQGFSKPPPGIKINNLEALHSLHALFWPMLGN